MSSHRLRWFGIALFGLAVLVAPRRGVAQLAPTGGHYGGRASDTGFEPGGPNALGSYAATVPLSLPPAHGDLPIPLSVVHGPSVFGAAGVGWDVPLSYVQDDTSFGHRRPALVDNTPPLPRERVTLVLPGRGGVQMVRKGGGWVGRADGADLSMKRNSDGSWLAFDGAGRTYSFTQDPKLQGTGLWLLDSVTGAAGGKVKLTYQITGLFLTGSPAPVTTVDLLNVRYDPHPTTLDCYKYEIDLGYSAQTLLPWSVRVVGGNVLGRADMLLQIDVNSHASCTTAPLSLRHYTFSYQTDPDTGLAQLSSVKLYGRHGTTEGNTALPIATYGYGTATYGGSAPVLRYQSTQSVPLPQMIALPNGADPSRLSDTVALSSSVFVPPTPSIWGQLPLGSGTLQSLTDVTGDGRADLVFFQGGQLWIARNMAGSNGTMGFGAPAPLYDGTLTQGAFEERSSKYARFNTPQTTGSVNIEYVWRQAIDFNGDGRIDLVDAAENPGQWTVYLNTPDTSGQGIKWQRRSVRVDELYTRMTSERHLELFDGYVPLSRRYTAHPYSEWRCWWQHDDTRTVTSYPQGFTNGACPPPTTPQPIQPEKTFVEWELKDVNGDGYPDMVMNSSPTQLQSEGVPTYDAAAGQTYRGTESYVVAPIGDPDPTDPTKRLPNHVDVALNVRGIMLSNTNDFYPFAEPTTFVPAAHCGLSEWDDAQGTDVDTQYAVCDLTDVNGDGIADYATADGVAMTVRLGTGSGFDTVSFPLPAPNLLSLSTQTSQQPKVCTAPGWQGTDLFSSTMTTALRDLNGDGIPDLVHFDDRGAGWEVFMGTGYGFNATPIPIQGNFALSDDVESCDGKISRTTAGLFDLDGDGKPEMVALSGNTVTVSRLLGNVTAGTPEAGQLVRIDNGYGAITSIQYRSAKEDPILLHQVPYPEIVATSVSTVGTEGLGGTLNTTYYAYGGAVMMYDQALDTYRLPAYSRTVELHDVIAGIGRANAQATITDTYPLALFDPVNGPNMTKDDRFGRYLKAGRTSDVTVLSVVGSDPWALLDVNIYGDARRMGATHYNYGDREIDEPDQQTIEDADDFCFDIIDPYTFDNTGLGTGSGEFDPCSAHGFVYTQQVVSWRGTAAPPSTASVEKSMSVLAVDDYARPTSVLYGNDDRRSDDDYCVDTTFATPASTGAPVLTAASSRKVYDCTKGSTNAVYAFETFEFDHLPLGSVSAGLVTGHNVERHVTDTGAILTSYRDYDISYDAGGNPNKLTRTREDGSKRTTTITYDAFDLVPGHVAVAGSGTATLNTYYALDNYTLDILETRDANNAMRGTRYDGFGRPTTRTFRVLGGTLNALSSLSYLGFTGGDPLGRRIVAKTVTDPVALTAIATAPGRTATTYLDELGRQRLTQMALGSDYGNETLVVDATSYDGIGRVAFVADPYPASQDPATAYGTTRYFNVDGSPSIFLQNHEHQPNTSVPDASVERFPTLYRHSFDNYQESLSVQQPDSLTSGTPENGVLRAQITSAVGRVLFRSTWQGGTRLEHEQLNDDRLGQLVGIIRYGDPAGATLPVQWSATYDALGNLVKWQNPGAGAPQTRTYSNWGELKQIDWTPPSPEPVHSVIRKYDSLGRLMHAEEQNGGVTDTDTVYDYAYDAPKSPTTSVTPTNVIGRMSVATAPTGAQYFSYDNYGDVNTRVFTDETAAYYIERESFHGDASLASVELDLPDNAYTPERVDYGYDSAGRARSMLYSDGTSTQPLYTATTLDPFGRLRKSSFANTTYVADYADTGRRLFTDATVSSPGGLRTLSIDSYDAVGRELSRTENAFTSMVSSYDALGRLATSVKQRGSTTLGNWSFGYDALGNIAGLNDYVGTKDAAISYGTADRDQICRINYGGTFGLACNVTYDSFGNVVYEGTRTGARKLSYYNSGQARRIDDSAGSSVTMKYDPFGREQELDLASSGETRSDRRYGAHIYHRYQLSGPLKSNYFGREFAGPGVRISRRGVGGPWVIAFQETRGMRFSTDEGGTFLQDVDYQPFGEATSSGAAAGTPVYSPEQWNEGDALGATGVVHVGARLYDPVIGRFLSRDALMVPRTAATTNPYAFAFNNPVGHTDPTGFDPPETQDPGTPQMSLTDVYNATYPNHPVSPPPTLPHQVLRHAEQLVSDPTQPKVSSEDADDDDDEDPMEDVELGLFAFAMVDNEELKTIELTVVRNAAHLTDGYDFLKADYEYAHGNGWINGLKMDAAMIKFGLATFGGKAGAAWIFSTEQLVPDAAHHLWYALHPDQAPNDNLEEFGEQQAREAERIKVAREAIEFQHHRQDTVDADDANNAALWGGPVCTVDGYSQAVRDEREGIWFDP